MSNFDLSLTGAQINAALNKVHNPDTTPTDGSQNVVTSDGVFDAVNDIQFANLNSSLVKTDISSGTNNTTLATSAAIKSYIDNAAAQNTNIAYFTASNGSRTSDGVINTFSETSDPGAFCSTDGSTISIGQNNICTVIFSGRYARSSGNTYTWAVRPRVYDNGYHTEQNSFSAPSSSSFSDGDHKRITYTTGFNSVGLNRTMYASIRLDPNFIGQCRWKEVTITVIRHLQA